MLKIEMKYKLNTVSSIFQSIILPDRVLIVRVCEN